MFRNQIAIVTGGGSGIGRAVCRLLANENASVLVADQNLAGAKETLSMISSQGQHAVVQVDVSKPESVREMFESVSKTYGSDSVAQLLVNSAGITRDGWMLKMSPEDFDLVLAVNLKGTFLATQLACKKMIDLKKSGAIVNISSISGKTGNIGQANYAASKMAVEGFTRNVANEMGKFNIRCNAVVPGFIETPIVNTIPDKG